MPWEIPEHGLTVWPRQFGWLKDQPRHYAVYQPEPAPLAAFDRPAFVRLHDQHWQIEQYHRVLKQVCHIEHLIVHSDC